MTQYLDRQVNHLSLARDISSSQENTMRWLKNEISIIQPDTPESEAKESLIEKIDAFIRERITFAQEVIAQLAMEKIQDGDVILTFAKSTVVEKIFAEAVSQGKKFKVIVVDSRPYFEGKQTVDNLSKLGIPTTYTLIHGAPLVLKNATKCFFGANAMLGNGFCHSRVGTAQLCMLASRLQKPVIICCEAIKFTDRIALDSIVMNELG